MYAYLCGKLADKTPSSVIIDCGGIGFDVKIPLSTYEKLPTVQSTVLLYTHQVVSEDEHRLFGFISEGERHLFRLLININRIGPKLALGILSGIPVPMLISAVQTRDHRLLAKVPGLGDKSAQRLIIELADKVNEIEDTGVVVKHDEGDLFPEVETALISLGYKAPDIRRAFLDLQKTQEITSLEQAIKLVIRYLYKLRTI